MKKQLIALSVCGAFCGLAYAEGGSVTISGNIDASVMTASKAYTGGVTCTTPAVGTIPASGCTPNSGSVTAFQDGAMTPSDYTLAGKEDLGGGLWASFKLSGGFNAGNGTHNSPGVYQTQTFGQEAKVGLSGDWGQVNLGLQLDPAFLAAIGTEARGMTDSLSSIEHWIIATAGNGFALQGGIFDANAISYSYSGNGLFIGVLYGFGGVAGSTSANSQQSIGASYSVSGFIVSAGYVEGKANIPAAGATPAYTGASSKIDFLGVGYGMGPYAIRAQYAEFKSAYTADGNDHSDIKNWNVGFDWKTGANKVNIAYENSKDNGGVAAVDGTGGKTREIALLDTYNLSKRTYLFGQVASVKVDSVTASGGPGLSGALGGIYTPVGLFAVSGETTTFFGLGIHHSF